jgi:hypothetical protein
MNDIQTHLKKAEEEFNQRIEGITQKQQEIDKLEAELKQLYAEPRSRQSAVGVMIQQAHVIRKIEAVDERLGKLRAEVHLLKNNNDPTEEIELIYYGANHVVETYIKGGILVKGGLLENYFKGRLATEHHNYVVSRHHKTFEKLIIEESDIDYYPIFNKGNVTIRCKLGDNTYVGSTQYKCRVDNETYFYFSVESFNFFRLEKATRGLSKKEKTLIKYVCAMIFRNKYRPNAHINLN